MIERVISGGQTGADQAGWRAAKAAEIPTGGWMPKGFLTEDGPRPEFAELYRAQEHHSRVAELGPHPPGLCAARTRGFEMKPDEIESGAFSRGPFHCPEPGHKSRIWVEGTDPVEFAWGAYWVFGTAAYWVSQYRSRFGREPIRGQALGHDLLEETAACILGGYGIPAEVGLAAFRRLRDAELFRVGIAVPADRFLGLLEEPLDLGRPVRYRFAYQRSCRLAGATRYFAESAPPPLGEPLGLRDWLLGIPGVGPKTASWIIRNQTGSDEVAIVDVHLRRAGEAAGIFPDRWRVDRDYALYERAFLGFARLGGVPASGLDALIWDEQRMMTARRRISTGLRSPERDWSGSSDI